MANLFCPDICCSAPDQDTFTVYSLYSKLHIAGRHSFALFNACVKSCVVLVSSVYGIHYFFCLFSCFYTVYGQYRCMIFVRRRRTVLILCNDSVVRSYTVPSMACYYYSHGFPYCPATGPLVDLLLDSLLAGSIEFRRNVETKRTWCVSMSTWHMAAVVTCLVLLR